MNYKDAIKKIQSLLKFGSHPGLGRMRRLLKLAGNPHKNLLYVHVAGTNGKGTVCHALASILKESGYKTGLFVSPSVLDFRERIQLNGNMISKTKTADLVKYFEPLLDNANFTDNPVTEFEFVTAMAFKFFCNEKCDIVVLETGMGGRLDATNIIENPLCSVITSVSLDHTEILGNSIEKIAFEKCGIIKPHSPVILGCGINPCAKKIIEKFAREKRADVFTASQKEISNIKSDDSPKISFKYKDIDFRTDFIAKYQINNCLTALKTCEVISKKVPISQMSLIKGLKNTKIPCRMEVVHTKPTIILDGAHNPEGSAALADFIRAVFKNKKPIGIIGMFKDKDADEVIKNLAPMFCKIFTTQPPSSRSLKLDEITRTAQKYHHSVKPFYSIYQAISEAVCESNADIPIIICGSFSIMKNVKDSIIKIFKK